MILLVFTFVLTINFFCRPDVLILYGSQTGNAESIAETLSEKCAKNSITYVCQTLNSMKGKDLKTYGGFLVVIVSTTGNGDSPENCEAYWRNIKLRSKVLLF